MRVTFSVPFPIVPKGRPRKGKHGFYTPSRTTRCETGIALAYRSHQRPGSPMLVGPLRLSVWFAKGRGDLDNRIKTISDALNGIAYEDDRQIRELHAYETDQKVSTIEIEEMVKSAARG